MKKEDVKDLVVLLLIVAAAFFLGYLIGSDIRY